MTVDAESRPEPGGGSDTAVVLARTHAILWHGDPGLHRISTVQGPLSPTGFTADAWREADFFWQRIPQPEREIVVHVLTQPPASVVHRFVTATGGERLFHTTVIAAAEGDDERLGIMVDLTGEARGGSAPPFVDPRLRSLLARLQTDFLRIAGHELQTPMAILKGQMELLLRKASTLPEDLQISLQGIVSSVDRLTRVVTKLIEVEGQPATIGSPPRATVQLDALVAKTVEAFAPRDLRHTVTIADTVPAVVQGRNKEIRRLLTSLLDNAARFSPEGSTITVTLSVDAHDAMLVVSDAGIGIPTTVQGRIFTPFFRAHGGEASYRDGIGLGLHLVREAADRLGGSLVFSSQEDGGSTFILRLPLARPGQRENEAA